MDNDHLVEWSAPLFPQDDPSGMPGKSRSGGAELRDFFAAHAPMIATQAMTHTHAAEMMSDWAYIYADAMMRRRLNGPK